MTIRRPCLVAACVAFCGLLCADELKDSFEVRYTKVLEGLREARTRQDLLKVADSFDAPEWRSVLPSGESLTREQAIQQLERSLNAPPERRPELKVDILNVRSAEAGAVVLGWIYFESVQNGKRTTIGALFRDTFAKSAGGWMRVRHEKIIDTQPLSAGGEALILPPVRRER